MVFHSVCVYALIEFVTLGLTVPSSEVCAGVVSGGLLQDKGKRGGRLQPCAGDRSISCGASAASMFFLTGFVLHAVKLRDPEYYRNTVMLRSHLSLIFSRRTRTPRP